MADEPNRLGAAEQHWEFTRREYSVKPKQTNSFDKVFRVSETRTSVRGHEFDRQHPR